MYKLWRQWQGAGLKMIPGRLPASLSLVVVLAGFLALAHAGPLVPDMEDRARAVVLKLEAMRADMAADLHRLVVDIQKSRNTIAKSQEILRQAQSRGNAPAEQVAREALSTAQKAKNKNELLKEAAVRNMKRIEDVLARVQKGEVDPEASLEQVEYETMNDRWVRKQRRLIEQRLQNPNPYADEIYRSLKTKAPPALPDRRYDQLQPGDVLLISPETETLWDKVRDKSWWINVADSGTTEWKSPASHTVLFLKEVNGNKLFLDNTPERGTHVINEAEFQKTYAHRGALVAAAAQPVSSGEAERIWSAARELVKREAAVQQGKSGNIVDQTGYGLFGNNDMVCSEASRWALVRAGREIPESSSPLKRLLGIHYGPANFFSDDHNFIITPLWGPLER